MSDCVSAACRVIRFGTFKFINAVNARTDTDLHTNLHLYPDHFAIQITDHPQIIVNSSQIRQILTFFGRELPRALMCVLVTDSLATSIVAALTSGGDTTSIEFCPSSKNVAEKFIVLFPSDESSFEFQLIGDKFPWFSKRIPLRTDEARELVLATAGRRNTVSFIRDLTEGDEASKKSFVGDKASQKSVVDNYKTSVLDNEQTTSVVDVQFKNNDKTPGMFVSPIFATAGAVKLLTKKELDHLALARHGKSLLRKRESEFGDEGVGKVRKAEEVRIVQVGEIDTLGHHSAIDTIGHHSEIDTGDHAEIDAVGDDSEIFTVPLCDLDKNGMYVEENTSEVVIENTEGDVIG